MNLSKEARDMLADFLVELEAASDDSASKALRGTPDNKGRGSAYHNGKAVAYQDASIRLKKRLAGEKSAGNVGHLLANWV